MTAALTGSGEQDAGLSDEEVVTRIRTGELQLYEILMRRHNQKLYRTVRAILRDDDEVEDVVQEAYVSAYRHLASFRGGRASRPGSSASPSIELSTGVVAGPGSWP